MFNSLPSLRQNFRFLYQQTDIRSCLNLKSSDVFHQMCHSTARGEIAYFIASPGFIKHVLAAGIRQSDSLLHDLAGSNPKLTQNKSRDAETASVLYSAHRLQSYHFFFTLTV